MCIIQCIYCNVPCCGVCLNSHTLVSVCLCTKTFAFPRNPQQWNETCKVEAVGTFSEWNEYQCVTDGCKWSIDNLPILLSHKCLCFLHWQTFLFMTMIHVHFCYHFLVLLFSLKELLMYLYLQHLCKQHQYFSKICIICKICVILLFPDSILKQHVSKILAKQMSRCYPCLLEYLHEAVMETFIKKS